MFTVSVETINAVKSFLGDFDAKKLMNSTEYRQLLLNCGSCNGACQHGCAPGK